MERQVRLALIGVLAAIGCLVLCALAALHSPGAHWVDAKVLEGFVALSGSSLHGPAVVIAHVADPVPFIMIGGALVALSLARGRPRVALAIALMLPAAALSAEGLKQLLAEPRIALGLGHGQVVAASFPSGHATGSMALALALVLAVSPRWRPTVALAGTGFTLAVSYSLLTLGWHYPSDVLGGYLLASIWALLAVAGLLAAWSRWPAPAGRRAATAALALRLSVLGPRISALRRALRRPRPAVLASLIVIVLLAHAPLAAALAFAHTHHAVVIGALTIATLALAVAAATTAAIDQRR